ncbi:MAG: VCBS repeat-containing protein [Candidatus Zixiibacteriota bacterium]|nr:MAG: VCBS repeat-containing protein [candidate division Zixibacteria bacterium]
MKTLILIMVVLASPIWAGDLTVPPGYEIVKIEGNRVEIKDLTTGYVTPYWTKFYKDTIDTSIIAETQDETPREWYYFERLALLPWYSDVVGADLNHSGVGEIYGQVGGITYVDTISSGWNFDLIPLGSYDGPRMSGDTDNDGNMELLTHGNDYLTLLESDSYHSYPTNVIWSYYHNTSAERNPKLGDLDGDGYGEIWYYSASHIAYQMYEIDSSGNYNFKTGIPFWDYVQDYVGEPSFGDIDGDGLTEIFAGGIHGEVVVFENVADDSFEFVWQYQLAEPSAYVTEYIGDTDGDGLNEFMMAAMDLFGGNGILFTLFETDGDNSYQNIYDIAIERYSLSRGDIIVGDFGGNSLNEILLCTGKNTVLLTSNDNDSWIEILRFKSSIRSSNLYYYKRYSFERPIAVNVIRPTWETFLLRVLGGFFPGDVNNDSIVNGNDVVFFISYIKNGGDIEEPIIRADANGDCAINLVDVSYLVDYFKGRLPAPQPGWCHFYVE